MAEKQGKTEIRLPKNVMLLPIDSIKPYPNNPYKLYIGQRFKDMVNSVKANGVLNPIVVRRLSNGEYQILSGHNRVNAAIEAGLSEILAVIIEVVDDDEAALIVAEANATQRSVKELSHSERAGAMELHHRGIKRQGARTDKNSGTSPQNEEKLDSRDSISKIYGFNANKVDQYIRIARFLNDELKTLLDKGNFKIAPAVELSHLKKGEQIKLSEILSETEYEDYKIETKKAKRLREESTTDSYPDVDKLSKDDIRRILQTNENGKNNIENTIETKKAINLKSVLYDEYFSNQNENEVEKIIEEALKMYFNKDDTYTDVIFSETSEKSESLEASLDIA
jgi:ParB family chromosome partitioning protein